MRPEDLRRLRGEAEAAWTAALQGEADRLLAIPDLADRAHAYEELTRSLAEGGEALSPADAERVRRSFAARPSGAPAHTVAAPSTWRARQEAARRFERMLRLAPFGATAAALTPAVAAMWFWGWRPGGLLGVALSVFSLPAVPLLACLVTVAVAGLAVWLTSWAETYRGLQMGIGAALLTGVAVVVCVHALPVYRAGEGAVVAGGHSLAGAIVRVEYAHPAAPWPRGVRARGYVLWGSDQVRRGTVLHYAGDPVRHLRGG